MTYVVQGLSPQPFTHFFSLGDEALAVLRARRVRAAGPGFPCRVSLEEAGEGEKLILLNHVSHDVETPFRTSYSIFVREGAAQAPALFDQLPPLLDRRRLSLRGFDAAGMLRSASLAEPGEGDAAVRALFAEADIIEVHAHNAAYGCFLARIERN
jgi:hypothetical protein